jgi:uncharacterized protein YbcI
VTGSGPHTDKAQGLASALRRFPTHAAQIHTLIERNESFRGMCEDLACVERALLSVDELPEIIRAARRVEFVQMADSLAAEIERALGQIKVSARKLFE